jgi:hypothetical protein
MYPFDALVLPGVWPSEKSSTYPLMITSILRTTDLRKVGFSFKDGANECLRQMKLVENVQERILGKWYSH